MNRLICALTATVLSACGPSDRLSSLEMTQLIASPGSLSSRLDELTVRLYYTDQGHCVTLPDSVMGTVNGNPSPRYFPGGMPEEPFPTSLFTHCQLPSFTVPLAQIAGVPEVTVAFEGDGERVAATFRFLGTRPSVTVTPPADGHIRPGSTVELSYAPDTDDLSEEQWFLMGSGNTVEVDRSNFQGARGTFTIPALVQPGPAFITVLGKRIPAIASCEAYYCDASYTVLSGSDSPGGDLRTIFEIEP